MSERALVAAKLEADRRMLRKRALEQIRDALVTLSAVDNDFYEDEAQVSLDALDWLEENCP